MILTDRSVKTQIKYQVPWFFNQEYPLFVKFLEYYYQWVELHDDQFKYGVLAIIDNFNQLKDIDQTVEELIPFFRNPYFRNIPEQTVVARRLFIKRMIDLYRSKGSFKSLNLLIKIILGEEIEVWYPKDLLARPSNIESSSYYYGYLRVTNPVLDNIFDLQTNTVEINGIPVLVSAIGKVVDLYEVVLDFDLLEYTTIKDTKEVYFQGVQIGELVPILDKITFVSGTRINKQNELFLVSSPNQQTPAVCKISRVKPGRIDSYTILRRGSNYILGDRFVGYVGSLEFSAIVSNITPTGEIGRLTIQKNASVTSNIPTIVGISETGFGANIDWYSSEFKTIQEVEIVDGGIDLSGEKTTSLAGSQFSFQTTFIAKRTQVSSTNNLGNFNILPDNLLWQDHSYVLNFTSTFTEFPKEEVNYLFKPLGSKLFYNKTELIECLGNSVDSFGVEGTLEVEPTTKIVNLLISNLQTSFTISSRKYTNDTPLLYVGSTPVFSVDSRYCFEVKPEIGTLTFEDVSSLENLENALNNLKTALASIV